VHEVVLPYGRTPRRLRVGADAVVVEARGPVGPAPAVTPLLEAALDAPIGTPRMEALVRPGDRVTVIVSDATRAEPRDALLAAVRARLPDVRLTVAIATGTHGRCGVARLDLSPGRLAGAAVVDHDGHEDANLVALGTTTRGTPVRVHRCVVEADLVVATGAIRPHYFAGFGAGIKAVFPGLGGATEIRINHRLKQAAGARAGEVLANPCRADLEEVAEMAPAPLFLLNTVCDPDDDARDAVAGHVIDAFRAGCARAAPWFRVEAPRRRWIVASDALPVTASLYQASKIVAAVAPLLDDDGTIVLVAECVDGIGPLATVNEAIYEIGLRPRLPARHRIVLVSGLDNASVAPTFATWAPSLDAALAGCDGPMVIAPRASRLVIG
jgi:nickel-dependent lactate racemase